MNKDNFCYIGSSVKFITVVAVFFKDQVKFLSNWAAKWYGWLAVV